MARPLEEVLRVIIKIVPNDYKNKKQMTYDLQKVRDSVAYAAPEAMGFWWHRASELLVFHMHDAHTFEYPWAVLVQDIFNNKIDYREAEFSYDLDRKSTTQTTDASGGA